MILEIATKEYPYGECSNQAQIYKKVTSGIKPAALAKVVDEETRMFIELCIQHNPTTRPSATELLSHPFLATVAISAVIETAMDRPFSFDSNHSFNPLPPASSIDTGRASPDEPSKTHTIDAVNHKFFISRQQSSRLSQTSVATCTIEAVLNEDDNVTLKMVYNTGLKAQEISFPFDLGIDTATDVVSELQEAKLIEGTDEQLVRRRIEEAVRVVLMGQRSMEGSFHSDKNLNVEENLTIQIPPPASHGTIDSLTVSQASTPKASVSKIDDELSAALISQKNHHVAKEAITNQPIIPIDEFTELVSTEEETTTSPDTRLMADISHQIPLGFIPNDTSIENCNEDYMDVDDEKLASNIIVTSSPVHTAVQPDQISIYPISDIKIFKSAYATDDDLQSEITHQLSKYPSAIDLKLRELQESNLKGFDDANVKFKQPDDPFPLFAKLPFSQPPGHSSFLSREGNPEPFLALSLPVTIPVEMAPIENNSDLTSKANSQHEVSAEISVSHSLPMMIPLEKQSQTVHALPFTPGN